MPENTPPLALALGSSSVRIPMESLRLPLRPVRVTCQSKSPHLELLRRVLLPVVQFEQPIRQVVQEPLTPGRSCFVHSTNSDVIKLKGALGLDFTRDAFLLSPPTPLVPYGNAQGIPHLHFNPDTFMPELIRGKPKVRFSQTRESAEREFQNYKVLMEGGVASEPITAGMFLTQAGTAERDFYDRETGFVALRLTPHAKPAEEFCSFLLDSITDRSGLKVWDFPEGIPLTVPSLFSRFERCVEIISRTKMKAMVQHGLAHHAGHMNNFLLTSIDEKLGLISDLDSCKILEPTDPARGAELLRSIALDMVKSTYHFAVCAYSEPFLRYLQNPDMNFFKSLIRGFFASCVDDQTRSRWAGALRERYLKFVCEHASPLALSAARPRIQKARSDGGPVSLTPTIAEFHDLHKVFLADCLEVTYQLIRQSNSLQQRDIRLPKLPDFERKKRWAAAVQLVQQ